MADRNATAVVGVARKDGEPGLEIHAVGCADIAKGGRTVHGTFANVDALVADYFDDMISEGEMDMEQCRNECRILPCVNAKPKVVEVFGVPCDYCGDTFLMSEMVRCHAECETLFCATHGEKYVGTAVPAVRS